METYLQNVLIKEVGGTDKVFVVDNLPKSLLYRKAKKLVFVPRYAVDYDRSEPKEVEAYTLRDENMPDEPRNRKVTHELVDELLPGIELSQNGDGGFTFFIEYNEAKDRLRGIDAFIRQELGPTAHIPARVDYSSQPGSFTAGPKPISSLPRVVLPVHAPVSPPVKSVQDSETGAQPSSSSKWTDEMRAAAGARLKAAREAKKIKSAV